MQADVFEALEFLRLRNLLAGLASSHLGKERLNRLSPLPDRDRAETVLRRVACLMRLREAGQPLPMVDLPDLSGVLSKLDREGTRLDADAFLALEKLLDRLGAVHGFAASTKLDVDAVADLLQGVEPHPDLEELLHKTFEPSGEIKDTASSALRKIRRERERVRGSLRRTMERQAESLAEGALVTLREGRFVLSVPAKKEKRVQGIVHGRSGTGSTVYLEPLASVDENNRLSTFDAQEFEELQRILLHLTETFASRGDSLQQGYALLGELDDLDARARLALRWRAQPPVFSPEARIELTQARHPLLLEARGVAAEGDRAFGEVIPLNLRLDEESRLLLISGPNMGGKTVAMKTVGLLSLMAQAGLCLPVQSAVMGWFDAWVVDVGDDQSLEADMSTFGGHLRHWAQALDQAGPRTLVLLDEMGSGTDPTEGAALAQSVLEVLVERGALGVVTTHLGALKRFAASAEGMENASMVFDGDSGAPTFTMAPGVPGDSHALDMAAHLGFPRERVERAEVLLGPEERALKKLLADVEEERNRLREEHRRAAEEKDRAQERTREAEESLRRVLEHRNKLRDRAARQARDILQKAQSQARALEQSARGGKQASAPLQEAAARRQAELARLENDSAPREEFLGPAPETVEPGERYMAVSLGGPVTVLRADPGETRVLVDRRGMKVELPRTDLRLLGTMEEGPAETSRRSLPVAEDAPREINLIGSRREEALEALDQALDRALLAGLLELRVVHGFGTGALMQAVRDFVGSHPAVQSFRPGEKGEGGGGATIVKLKDA